MQFFLCFPHKQRGRLQVHLCYHSIGKKEKTNGILDTIKSITFVFVLFLTSVNFSAITKNTSNTAGSTEKRKMKAYNDRSKLCVV